MSNCLRNNTTQRVVQNRTSEMTRKRQRTYAWNSLPQKPCVSAEEMEHQHDTSVTKSQKTDITQLLVSGKLQSKNRCLGEKESTLNQGYQDKFERMSISSILHGNTATLQSSQICCQTSAKRGNSQFGDRASVLTALLF